MMSLALLRRDGGDAEEALSLWRRVSRLPGSLGEEEGEEEGGEEAEAEAEEGEEEGEYDWADAFVYEPRRRCVGLATMHAALLASQLGRHAEAEGAIRSFGFRWRLSPCVWRAARVPARKVPPPAGSGLRDGCPVRVCPTLSLEITRD